jgi:hypothetical protein
MKVFRRGKEGDVEEKEKKRKRRREVRGERSEGVFR